MITDFCGVAAFPAAFPIARYRFSARMREPLALPHYAGSLLRGMLGAALRNVACMTRQPTCTGCPLLQTCPYSQLFETPAPVRDTQQRRDFSQIPHAYVVEPPPLGTRALPAGAMLEFHIVLFGKALQQLALVVFALQRGLARGLGRERSSADLMQVDWMDANGTPHSIWNHESPTLQEHPNAIEFIATDVRLISDTSHFAFQSLQLDFYTPLRLQRQEGIMGVQELNPPILMAALMWRVALMQRFHMGQAGCWDRATQITEISAQLHDTRELRWHDARRYSSRQKQEIPLSGVLGRWILYGDENVLLQIYPWLWLGQWLHIGKSVVMGLGGYSIHPHHVSI